MVTPLLTNTSTAAYPSALERRTFTTINRNAKDDAALRGARLTENSLVCLSGTIGHPRSARQRVQFGEPLTNTIASRLR